MFGFGFRVSPLGLGEICSARLAGRFSRSSRMAGADADAVVECFWSAAADPWGTAATAAIEEAIPDDAEDVLLAPAQRKAAAKAKVEEEKYKKLAVEVGKAALVGIASSALSIWLGPIPTLTPRPLPALYCRLCQRNA